MRKAKPNQPTRYWAGFDIAKKTFQAALWGHKEFSDMEVHGFLRQKEVVREALGRMKAEAPKGMPLGIVMEATGKFSEQVAVWLLELDPRLRVAIVNPAQTASFIKSLGFRNKTDDLDAKALARYGHERNPVAWEPPSPEMAVLRDLTRTRADLVAARTAMKNRLNDHERASSAASDALSKIIESLAGQVEALDEAIQGHLKAQPELGRQVRLYMTIQGIGIVTSTVVLAEMGDLHRFERSRKLAAFAGLSPKLKDSGTSVHGKPRMCKQGSARVRTALYMAASNAIQYNPDMKAFYERLCKQGKVPRAALGAVMRKLLVLMRAVLVAGEAWKPRLAA
jgi:transposase